ncbi:hypothetical protein VTN00DRAFT_3997 [Thermoascus crustaceus]|uniref:uncharacterized protein n=1 Tax=Thermoascus crustaceus TaxID=5088 RepID=UPI003741EE17
MFDNGIFGWFKSSKEERAPERTWDPKTMTMEQPTSPPAPSTERVVTEQPRPDQEMHLRGGAGAGDICCGVCAGLMCFECCEECC